MDIADKLTNPTTTSWEPYNNIAIEEDGHHTLQTPFDQFNYVPYVQTHHQLSVTTSNPLRVDPTTHGLKLEAEEKEEEEDVDDDDDQEEDLGAMKEMMFKIASMQPVDIDPATIRKPKRRNVRISDDPQSVAARHRRERISEKIRILQRLVPGGTKMDTASMLDEAIRYVKFLKRQIRILQANNHQLPPLPIPPSTTHDWAAATSDNAPIFGGNCCNITDGAGRDDIHPMCFNNNF